MTHFRMRGPVTSALFVTFVLFSVPATSTMMALPTVSIISPAAGATIYSARIPVTVAVSNFNLECTEVGKTNVQGGEGHLHAMVDGMDIAHLVEKPGCAKSFSFSGQGLEPGQHTLTVLLATDAHAMSSMPASVIFQYKPDKPTALPGAMTGGVPAVRITSPENGATVSKKFNLILAVSNFDLSCDLEGKKNVDGWGHVHVLVQQDGQTSASPSLPLFAIRDTPQGLKMRRMLKERMGMTTPQMKAAMTMSMPAMVGMPCTEAVPVDLSTWRSGPAKIIVQLAKNDHSPSVGASPAIIDVNLR